MAAVEIKRGDLSVAQLRRAAARTADAKQARRMLAIAMVLDGLAFRTAGSGWMASASMETKLKLWASSLRDEKRAERSRGSRGSGRRHRQACF